MRRLFILFFPRKAVSLSGELVGGIAQGVQDGYEVLATARLAQVLANQLIEFVREGHGAPLPVRLADTAVAARTI
jgi:hypothetical protein